MPTLLDELEEINVALTEGEATEDQERRGIEIVELCDQAPELLSQVKTLKQQLEAERSFRKEIERDAKKLRRQQFSYKDLQSIYNRMKADAESDAQEPIDEQYREVLGHNEEMLVALQHCLRFAEHELEVRLPSGDAEYIAYAQKAADTARAAITQANVTVSLFGPPKTIIVRIEGGLVQDVTGIPKGYEVRVEDYDESDETQPQWDAEKECFVSIYEGEPA